MSPKPKDPNQGTDAKKKGLLEEVGNEVKENLNITPQTVTEALVKDAKQAVNYEIRRGLRNLISGFFKR